MTRKTLFHHIVRTMLLEGDGNQVTYPRYSSLDLLDNLEPFPASKVRFAETPAGYVINYGELTYMPDEVLHFRINSDPDMPWLGSGYKAVLKDVVKGLRQAGATKQALMESPAPSIIVKVDGLTEEFASKEGRDALAAQFLDSSENGRPWFIPAGAFEVEQVKPLTLNDLAIAKNMEIDKRTAAAIYGVPPFLVGVGEYKKDEYNNFITRRIMSIAKVIEQELTRQLLISPDLYWRFNSRSLMAYNIDEIVTAGSEMVDRMAMRRNEWRDWMGMSPDPEMEELLALENYIPADKLGDQKKLKGGGKQSGKTKPDGPDDSSSAESGD